MSPKRKTLFVIFAGPQQHGGPGTCYIAQDGTITGIRSRAAKFYSFAEAERFAKARNITLSAITYIGQEGFTDFEIQMGS
ncbi:protein of unknown function [Candidatus Methylomirabilis oxygeniifera]|uniref:Uncharacterized protein n=1 Tax=Methylomirabilis oxygeniifera TaxID=671143 RepID=D5MMW9_METO1|nr:protein of unknown function [Candidatus Methylomirabilis oxyfera]